MNSNEVEVVKADLAARGIQVGNYTMRQGNNCIWVSHGLVDCYYIFNDGKLVDVQFD